MKFHIFPTVSDFIIFFLRRQPSTQPSMQPSVRISTLQITQRNGNLINLGEVTILNNGVSISRSLLTFGLSSVHAGLTASLCNDGDMNSFCHSDSSDPSPTLTVTIPGDFDEILVTNRVNCCQIRIVGATIIIKNSAGVEMWNSFFSYETLKYRFLLGKPSSQPSKQPNTSPSGQPSTRPTS